MQQVAAVLERDQREGLTSLFQVGALFWLLMSHRFRSLRLWPTLLQLDTAISIYRQKLASLADNPHCLSYLDLLRQGYLKQKHWLYAAFMATLSSLPLLRRVCNFSDAAAAIEGKASIGVATKLLDNLNDEVQTVEQALASLGRLDKAMTEKTLEWNLQAPSSIPAAAENSALQVSRWTYDALRPASLRDGTAFKLYVADVRRLIQGQVDSLTHRRHEEEGRLPTIGQYLQSIAEKSIGGVWVDVDLCFLWQRLGGFSGRFAKAVSLLRDGNDLAFKSSLIFDDVQDLKQDLATESINSAVLLGLDRGVLKESELHGATSVEQLADRLLRTGILDETLQLADMVFLEGVQRIEAAAGYDDEQIVDWKGLSFGYRFVRLFNLRKLLAQNRDLKTMRLFASSLDAYHRIKAAIPDRILALNRYVAAWPQT